MFVCIFLFFDRHSTQFRRDRCKIIVFFVLYSHESDGSAHHRSLKSFSNSTSPQSAQNERKRARRGLDGGFRVVSDPFTLTVHFKVPHNEKTKIFRMKTSKRLGARSLFLLSEVQLFMYTFKQKHRPGVRLTGISLVRSRKFFSGFCVIPN